jgi:transposase
MEELIPEGYIFMDDNAPSHRARIVSDMKERSDVEFLDWWPPHSPDLNPIENLWGILKERVRKRNPRSREQLWDMAVEEWANFPFEIINSLVDSMPNRIRLVLRARGHSIKY